MEIESILDSEEIIRQLNLAKMCSSQNWPLKDIVKAKKLKAKKWIKSFGQKVYVKWPAHQMVSRIPNFHEFFIQSNRVFGVKFRIEGEIKHFQNCHKQTLSTETTNPSKRTYRFFCTVVVPVWALFCPEVLSWFLQFVLFLSRSQIGIYKRNLFAWFVPGYSQ